MDTKESKSSNFGVFLATFGGGGGGVLHMLPFHHLYQNRNWTSF
jgi:hypothetical protein